MKKRKKRELIDWKTNIELAKAWIKECDKIGIQPTTSQLQKKFGWTQTVASKIKSFIKVMDSTENQEDKEN
jgi:hypothetical protein